MTTDGSYLRAGKAMLAHPVRGFRPHDHFLPRSHSYLITAGNPDQVTSTEPNVTPRRNLASASTGRRE
jgi:hypothetical protein